jgi:hypothetical protein
MTPPELCHEAARRGLRLERRGEMLAVIPAKLCPPEFAAELRQHKGELLDFLEGRAAGLAPDCAPWLHVAKQILAGEFAGADGSTRQSLIIGLRSVLHPLCADALARLNPATSTNGRKM